MLVVQGRIIEVIRKKTERRQVDRTRILNDKWVEMNFNKSFCKELEKKFHCWVMVTIEKEEEIVLSMEEDQGETIKYIHKYRDEETNEIKYCLAKVKTGGRLKSNKAYSIFKTREIDINWIYELCKDQGSVGWFYGLESIDKMNSTVALPIASMRNSMNVEDIPNREMYAPSIQFIQDAGTCGLSSFSSAFYEYFNKNIASEWMKKTNGYMMAMAAVQGNQSKRSSVMNYLKELVMKIKGNTYTVTNIKRKMSWTDLKTARYFKTIVICLLRGSDGSQDHIVSISYYWIFDSNLDFALPFNKKVWIGVVVLSRMVLLVKAVGKWPV